MIRDGAETADTAKDATAEAANVAGSKAKAGKDAAVDSASAAADTAGSKTKEGKDAASSTASGLEFASLMIWNSDFSPIFAV